MVKLVKWGSWFMVINSSWENHLFGLEKVLGNLRLGIFRLQGWDFSFLL